MESENENVMKKKDIASYGGTETESTVEDKELDLYSVYELVGLGNAQYLYWVTVFLASSSINCEFLSLPVALSSQRCEWSLFAMFEVLIVSLPLVSFGLSSAVFGKISDRYGRKPVLICAQSHIFMLVVVFTVSPTKWFVLTINLAIGAVAGIGMCPLFCYGAEFAPNKYREYGVISLLAGYEVGLVAIDGLGLLLLRSAGWRLFMVMMTSPALLALILLIALPASPRYLLVIGQPAKAMRSIRWIACLNKVSLPENIRLVCFDSEQTVLGSYTTLLSASHRGTVRALCILVSCTLFVQFGLTFFLHLLFPSDYCGVSLPLSHLGCFDLRLQDFLKLTITALFGSSGTVVASLIAVRVGRLIPLRVGYAILTVTLGALCECVCLNGEVTFATTMVIKTSLGFVQAIIWIIIPECFQTIIRTTAAGIILATGKLGGTLGIGCVHLI